MTDLVAFAKAVNEKAQACAETGRAAAWTTENDFNRALLETMSDGVVACDADGVLTLFNRTARAWHGLDPMRLRWDEWPARYDLYQADGATPMQPDEVPLARAYRGEPVVDVDMAIAARGQAVRFVVANGSQVTDGGGNKLGAVVVMRDVTKLRRVEAELRRAKEALEARSNESKGRPDQQLQRSGGTSERTPAGEEHRARLHFLEGMDRVNRAIQVARDLDNMMRDVLDVVLDSLECDRACLLHARDFDPTSWSCPMQRTRAGAPSVTALGSEDLTRIHAAHAPLRNLLANDGPVRVGPGSGQRLPPELQERYGIQSVMAVAIEPRVGKPWQLVVHQCSHPREWSPDDQRSLHEIGRRLADGLTTVMVHRDLLQSEAKYRRIVDTATEGIWALGPDGRTELVNARTADLLGFTVEEMVGRPMADFVVEEELADHERRMENRRQGIPERFERRFRRKDGGFVWTLASATPILDSGQRYAGSFAMIADVSEQKHAEELLRRSNRELRAISSCSQALIRAEDEETLLNEICSIICTEAGYRLAWVGYAENDEAKTIRPVASAGHDHGYIANAKLSWSADLPHGQGPAGIVIRSGELIYVQDFRTDALMSTWRAAALERGYRSGIALPLKNPDGNTFGAFLLYSAESNALNEDEVRLMAELAGDLAFGIAVLRDRAKREDAERRVALQSFALNMVRESLFLTDDNARLIDVNEEACRVLGYSREELLDMGVADIDPDYPADGWRQSWAGADREQASLFSTSYRAKDDRRIPVEVNTVHFEYAGKGYNLALARDITERQAAHQALQDTARRLSQAQRLAHIGGWDLDLTMNKLVWSDEIFRIFETDPDEFGATYEAFLEAVHPDDRAVVDAAFVRSLADRSPYDIDHRILLPDGRIKYVHERCETDYDGDRPIRSIGAVQDITARKLAEQAMRERESFIRNILDSVDEGIIVLDPTLCVMSANRTFCNSVGLIEEQVVGRKCHEINSDLPWPCSECGLDCPVQRTFATGVIHTAAHSHVDLQGAQRHVELRSYPVTNADGAVVSVIETVNDITERRELEEQLNQSQKMEAIGTLAGGIAHDFNNVLTAVVGYGALMKADMASGDPHRASIDQILSAAERAAQLTHGLLAFSRKQIMNPKPIDINQVVKNIEGLLRRLIGEDVELTTAFSAGDLVVLADTGQLDQVLMNLATNARDAMPEGGKLTIVTRELRLARDPRAAQSLRMPSRFALIAVSDTGIGMDDQTRQKVFEPFFTTKEVGKGTGLGLSIVYGIVKQHGGSINIQSEPGRGTTFEILLPGTSRPLEEAATSLTVSPPKGSETILVAEDDSAVRALMSTALTSHGYQVIEAEDGAKALEMLAEHGQAIDMMILDVIMPRRSGRDVYEAAKAAHDRVRALFVSGYAADIVHKRGILSEDVQFIAKPMSPADLLIRVREILDGG